MSEETYIRKSTVPLWWQASGWPGHLSTWAALCEVGVGKVLPPPRLPALLLASPSLTLTRRTAGSETKKWACCVSPPSRDWGKLLACREHTFPPSAPGLKFFRGSSHRFVWRHQWLSLSRAVALRDDVLAAHSSRDLTVSVVGFFTHSLIQGTGTEHPVGARKLILSSWDPSVNRAHEDSRPPGPDSLAGEATQHTVKRSKLHAILDDDQC